MRHERFVSILIFALVMPNIVQAGGKKKGKKLFECDFEDKSPVEGKMEVVSSKETDPKGEGKKIGRWKRGFSAIRDLRLDRRAKTVTLTYKRYCSKAPDDDTVKHYTRQHFRFDNTGEERHGEGNRDYIEKKKVGRWTEISITVDVPEGASKITLIELDNIAEKAPAEYDPPVYIDDIELTWDD